MEFSVNDGSRRTRWEKSPRQPERLEREMQSNISISLEEATESAFLSTQRIYANPVLVETMRREGFELLVLVHCTL